jgi:serine/threonine protein kinase
MASFTRAPNRQGEGQWEQVDAIVHRFEIAWQKGGTPPEIADYIPWDGPESFRLDVLADLVHADQHFRQAKEPVPLEVYLNRYPQLRAHIEKKRDSKDDVRAREGHSTPAELIPPCEFGNYHIEAKIDNGGMGVVYRATHAHLKKPVAFKILRPEYTADPKAVARFRREMAAIGKLDHNNIVRATDAHVGTAGDLHYLVMDLIDGIDLSKLVRLRGPLAVPEACSLVFQAANGLQCAHEHEMVHRDIKPSNLMLSAKGEVKILDLGLALLNRGRLTESAVTVTGQVMGTADYMAPEQWKSSHGVDIRADIYSLGFTLYTLLAGHPPFAGPNYGSAPQKMTAHINEPVTPITDHRPEVPAPIANLLARMVAKKPEDRPATPAEVAQILGPFGAGADLAGLARRGKTLQRRKEPEGQIAAEDAITTSRPPPNGTSISESPGTFWSRWRFPRKLRIGAFLAVGAVVIAIGGLFFAKHGQENLLDQVPVEIKFPRDGLSHWEIKGQGQQREIWVHADGESLLQTGEAKETGYEIRTMLEQFQWGEAGLFFGLHEDVYNGQPCKKYQVVKVVNRGEQFSIDHFTVWQLENTKVYQPGGKPLPIAQPARRGYSLKLTIGKGGAWRIYWNSQGIGPMADPNYPVLQNADLVGGFGVYNDLSTCVYRDTKSSSFSEANK